MPTIINIPLRGGYATVTVSPEVVSAELHQTEWLYGKNIEDFHRGFPVKVRTVEELPQEIRSVLCVH